MPYGTVNLMYGVPKGETTVTCTAGIGTFIIEFGALSKLIGDPIFEKVAMRAMRSLWRSRSSIDLVSFCKNGKKNQMPVHKVSFPLYFLYLM